MAAWQLDPNNRYDLAGNDVNPTTGNEERYVELFDQSFNPVPGTFGDDNIAGGAQDDVIFGQLGNDTIQGDGSTIDDTGSTTIDVLAHAHVGRGLRRHRRRRPRLGRGQRRQRHDLRRPRPGRPDRRLEQPLQPHDARPAARRQRRDLRRRRHRGSSANNYGDLSGPGPRPRRRHDPRRQRRHLRPRRHQRPAVEPVRLPHLQLRHVRVDRADHPARLPLPRLHAGRPDRAPARSARPT